MSPAGPAPMIATRLPLCAVTRPSAAISLTRSKGTWSMMWRLSQRMAMGSPSCRAAQALSHLWVQIRPQTLEKGLVS